MRNKIEKKLADYNLLPYLEYCNTRELNLGKTKTPIYFYDNQVKANKKLLITGGVDADEIDGIVAAFRLIKRFSLLENEIRIVILPLMNPSAFVNETDYTPNDFKFLKYYYPGDKNGSYTQELMYQLSKDYLKETSLWMDLHGGNRYEEIIPFIWGHETDVINQNIMTKTLLSTLTKDKCIYDIDHNWEKVFNLSKDGIVYVISESGNGFKVSTKAQNIHISRVEKAVELLEGKFRENLEYFESRVLMINAKKNKYWTPMVKAGDIVKVDQIVGVERGRFSEKKVKAKKEMQILWMRKESKLQTDQTVFGGLVLS